MRVALRGSGRWWLNRAMYKTYMDRFPHLPKLGQKAPSLARRLA